MTACKLKPLKIIGVKKFGQNKSLFAKSFHHYIFYKHDTLCLHGICFYLMNRIQVHLQPKIEYII